MPPFYVALLHIVPQKRYAVEVCQALKKAVNDQGGLVRKINNAGRRPLPTLMRAKMGLGKQRFAHIVTAEFVANPRCAVDAVSYVRTMDYCMRATLLREDELLLARPPRPGPEPRGCIQDWTPEGDIAPSEELLEKRALWEAEKTLRMKEKIEQGLDIYVEDLMLPEDRPETAFMDGFEKSVEEEEEEEEDDLAEFEDDPLIKQKQQPAKVPKKGKRTSKS